MCPRNKSVTRISREPQGCHEDVGAVRRDPGDRDRKPGCEGYDSFAYLTADLRRGEIGSRALVCRHFRAALIAANVCTHAWARALGGLEESRPLEFSGHEAKIAIFYFGSFSDSHVLDHGWLPCPARARRNRRGVLKSPPAISAEIWIDADKLQCYQRRRNRHSRAKWVYGPSIRSGANCSRCRHPQVREWPAQFHRHSDAA